MKHVRPTSSVLVAALLHTAAFAFLLRLPPKPSQPDAERGTAAALDAEPVEISVLAPADEAPPVTEGVSFGAPDLPPDPGPLATVGRGQARKTASPRAHALVETPAAQTTEGPPAPPQPAHAGPITLSPTELGIGAANPFVASAARQERAAQNGESAAPNGSEPAARKKNNPIANALRDAFRGPDGVVTEGPVIKALRDAASESIAPLDGRARFAVRINGNGEVYAVELLEGSGGSGWDDAAKRALAGLRGRKIPLPRGGRGANVKVEVASSMSFPSGQKHPYEFGLRPFGERTEGIVIPDESNIGQRPTRKIHSRTVGVELL